MLLLDTQILLWLAFRPERLSAAAVRLLTPRQAPLAFSLASLWEVAVKTSLGRPEFVVDPALLHRGLADEGFTELQLTADHVSAVAALPWVHRDPFDRMLVAQARHERCTLVTADATLKPYGRFVRVA